jgi:bifunctional non-homologous end joining protein LigD
MKSRVLGTHHGHHISARWKAKRVAPSRAKIQRQKGSDEDAARLVVAYSPSRDAALSGLEKWKSRHPEVGRLLAMDDVLVDSMRGRSSLGPASG